MSTSGNNEFLSAYFDDELPLEERAGVEVRLEASAAMRRELDELAQISDLLRAQPRRSAPPELAASALRRIERELLLDRPVLRPWPTVARAWTAIAASLSVSAAALFAIMQVAERPAVRDTDRLAIHTDILDEHLAGTTEPSRTASDLAGADAAGGSSEAATPPPPHFGRGGAGGVTAGGWNVPREEAAMGGGLGAEAAKTARLRDFGNEAGGQPLAATAPPAAGFDRAGGVNPRGNAIYGYDAPVNLKDSAEQEVIAYLAPAAENDVALVEVDVGDVAAGMEELQQILVGNSILPTIEQLDSSLGKSADLVKPADKVEHEAARAAPPAAVYVEGTRSQITGTFDQLRRNKAFRNVTYRGPADMQQIEVAETLESGAEAAPVDRREKQVELRNSLAQNVARYKQEQTTANSLGWQKVQELQRKALALKADAYGRPPAAPAADAAPTDGLRELESFAKSSDPPAVAQKPAEVEQLELARRQSFQFPLKLNAGDYTRQSGEAAPRYGASRSAAAVAVEQRRLGELKKREADETPAEPPLRVMFILQSGVVPAEGR